MNNSSFRTLFICHFSDQPPTIDPIFSNSFLPPSDEKPPSSVPVLFPSAHDFQNSGPQNGFPSPIGRKKPSWDAAMAPAPLSSPSTPPTVPMPIGVPIGRKSVPIGSSRPIKNELDVGTTWASYESSSLSNSYNPGIIGAPRSVLGLDSFDLDFAKNGETNYKGNLYKN